MSASNGVIRIGRKGRKKFAFGEEGEPGSQPFEVDVVVAFQQWVTIDESFREHSEDRTINVNEISQYHQAAVNFIQDLARDPITGQAPEISKAEALDFLARLREQYDELATFFRPKSRGRARLARFYGGGTSFLGGGEPTDFDEYVLELTMRRLKAQEMLENPEYVTKLTVDGYYKLLLRAGFNEEEATKATNLRSWQRLNAGEKI